MNTSDHHAEPSTRSTDKRSGAGRFLSVGIGFLVYETILIGVFGNFFFADYESALVMWAMIAIAAIGYFALGGLSGSWLSILLFLVPPMVAAAFDVVPPSVGGTETLDLDQSWILLTIVFLPAWFAGLFAAGLRTGRDTEHS